MREIEEMEQEIKDKWFNNHEAKITEYDGITILDWREPGTSIYSVRYIFCGSRLYVSGDIGDAIFNLTWIATPQSFNNIDQTRGFCFVYSKFRALKLRESLSKSLLVPWAAKLKQCMETKMDS